jgi:hypothetical protein
MPDHDHRDDYADPDLPPSRLPAIRDLVLPVVLGILFAAVLLLAWSRYW